MEDLDRITWLLKIFKEDRLIRWITIILLPAPFLAELITKLDLFPSIVAPAMYLATLVWLLFLGWKLMGVVHEMYTTIVSQTDQSSVRLIEGNAQIASELGTLIAGSNTVRFYGPVDDSYNFAETVREQFTSHKVVQIYDTLLDSTKKSLRTLIDMDSKHGKAFGYFACLYKQLVGVVIGATPTNEKQLLFFKNDGDNELKGVLINKNYRMGLHHVTDDFVKGVGPDIDFEQQVLHIKKALNITLTRYWEPMAKYGWIEPVMPPEVTKSVWEDHILEFFQNTAMQFASKAKKIIVTWRITDKALNQAQDISKWLLYLRNGFTRTDNCSVERTVLVDEKKLESDPDYKGIVDQIRTTYFPSADAEYMVEYRNLQSAYRENGFDLALFYGFSDEIIAVQGSTYDPNNGDLPRIYFDRSAKAVKECEKKVAEIKTYRLVEIR
jgi:hypothetical protein